MLGIFFITLFQTKKQLDMKKTLIFALCLEYHIILGCTYYKKLEEILLFEKIKPTSKFHK